MNSNGPWTSSSFLKIRLMVADLSGQLAVGLRLGQGQCDLGDLQRLIASYVASSGTSFVVLTASCREIIAACFLAVVWRLLNFVNIRWKTISVPSIGT